MSDGYSPVSPRLTARFTVSFPVYHVLGSMLSHGKIERHTKKRQHGAARLSIFPSCRRFISSVHRLSGSSPHLTSAALHLPFSPRPSIGSLGSSLPLHIVHSLPIAPQAGRDRSRSLRARARRLRRAKVEREGRNRVSDVSRTARPPDPRGLRRFATHRRNRPHSSLCSSPRYLGSSLRSSSRRYGG